MNNWNYIVCAVKDGTLDFHEEFKTDNSALDYAHSIWNTYTGLDSICVFGPGGKLVARYGSIELAAEVKPQNMDWINYWISPEGYIYVAAFFGHDIIMDILVKRGDAPHSRYQFPTGWVRISRPINEKNPNITTFKTYDIPTQKQVDALFDIAVASSNNNWKDELMHYIGSVRQSNPVRYETNLAFWHGTPTLEKAEAIIRDGVIRPIPPAEITVMTPVKDAVYLAVNPIYAGIYALSCDSYGVKTPKSVLSRYGRYGYLFEVPGSELSEVQPDEDMIGQMIYKGEPEWLEELAEDILTGVRTQFPEYYEEDLAYSHDLFRLVMNGDVAAWAEAGRILVDEMSDSQLLELLDLGVSIANFGSVHPIRCYRLDREKTQDMGKHGKYIRDFMELHWEV